MAARGRSGSLAFDDTCPICVRWANRVEHLLARRGIGLVALSAPWVRQRLRLRDDERADRMWLLLNDGRAFGGADAAIEIGRRVWWGWPFAVIAGLPGVRWLTQKTYLWVARRRKCAGEVCGVSAKPQA